ncbi:MAG: hypothetical protein HQL31_11505 [Planctomycetes bacterium]|nr:hypothetical protein [Planctomycetota bacterium]
MRPLAIDTGHGWVHLAGDKLYEGRDSVVKANGPLGEVKVILFFDSRGVSSEWNGSLLKLLMEYYQTTTYLAIARPLEMTTWATLYNFLCLNEFSPELLITNVGIVDFTPKKHLLCQTMMDQIRFGGDDGELSPQFLENYRLANGRQEPLYSVPYLEPYRQQLQRLLLTLPLLAIKTPVVDPSIVIERKRPASFFSQLAKTNEFIDSLGCPTVELGCFDERLTYDAVHWTPMGNRFVFDKVVGVL